LSDPVDNTQYNFTPTDFVIADSTGLIVLSGNAPAYQLLGLTIPEGGQILDVSGSPYTDYVVNKAVLPRPVTPATLTGTVLSNLPNPSTVTINGTAYTVTDGELDMTFPNAGTYAITVSSPFPYLDASFTHTQ
jgi:hypothetical protein